MTSHSNFLSNRWRQIIIFTGKFVTKSKMAARFPYIQSWCLIQNSNKHCCISEPCLSNGKGSWSANTKFTDCFVDCFIARCITVTLTKFTIGQMEYFKKTGMSCSFELFFPKTRISASGWSFPNLPKIFLLSSGMIFKLVRNYSIEFFQKPIRIHWIRSKPVWNVWELVFDLFGFDLFKVIQIR